MKPIGNYLMLKPIKEGDQVSETSGLITKLQQFEDPDNPYKKGVVLDMGNRVNFKMLPGKQIRIGDTVRYFKNGGMEMEHDGQPVILVHKNAVPLKD